MSTPIYYLKNGNLRFADKIIFDAAELYLYSGDKICLIGKNGSGKSTLLKIISSQYDLTKGDQYIGPNMSIAYLDQNPILQDDLTIYEFILGPNIDSLRYKADIIFTQLQIDGNKRTNQLSGGQVRRVYLAKALIDEPDILLLDEPTNHLDIQAIQWLEDFIKTCRSTVVCISHDRSFLTNITNKVWWIDQGIIRKSNKGFAYFDQWQEEVFEQKSKELQKISRKLDVEDDWLTYGVTARRKRNQKRLAQLMDLRQQLRSKQSEAQISKQKIHGSIEDAKKVQFIIEATDIGFSYESKPLFNNFSIRIKKGEKIGIVGKNGSGKTTLLKILTGELHPQEGKIKYGNRLDISYFDQSKSMINMEQSLQDNICDGGSAFVEYGQKTIHIAAYLKQFMFDTSMLNAKASLLSGGQASRLMLAKLLLKPGNLLIMDEPTNDLDMETIEILIELLSDYDGTCIIVSHDRDFLNRLVNKTLVFDNKGSIVEVLGSYEDYIKYHHKDEKNNNIINKKLLDKKNPVSASNQIIKPLDSIKQKISYKDKRQLELLPKEIKALEDNISDIEKHLADQNLYLQDAEKFNLLSIKLQNLNQKLEEKMHLWLELEKLYSDE